VTTARGIPVTTPNRTLLDLAAVLDARHVEKAINEGEILRLTNPNSLGDLVERHPRRKGIGALRSVLAAHAIGSTITRSELEDRFLQFLDEAALRTPQVNANIKIADRWIEADCVWPDDRLIVELDGRATHATPAAFERDRARDRVLQAAGWRVVRVTWRQLHDESVRLTSDLRKLLAE
jgi:very-short-patch-repair endonuclease